MEPISLRNRIRASFSIFSSLGTCNSRKIKKCTANCHSLCGISFHSSSRRVSRSSTEIATSVQSLDRYVRYAEGVEYDATNHTITMVTPGDSGAKQCVVITYQDATWKNGTVSDYGSVKVKTKPYDASVTSWSTRAVLGSVMNNESGGTSDDSLFASRLFTVDGTNRVVRYSPVTGSYVSGKPVTSNTSTSFTARNVKSGGTAIDFTPCV